MIQVFRKLTKPIFIIFLVITFTFAIWLKVLNQGFLGEGSIYFAHPYLSMLDHNFLFILWSRHDSQALLFFYIVRDLFKDNIIYYMLSLLVGASLVNLSVFYLIFKTTKNIYAGLLSVALLVANYVGSFEILGLGYYQWFIQRVPNFALAILGFIFLIKYLESKKRGFYFYSLVAYLFSVFLSRYTINILLLYLLYSFFKVALEKKQDIKEYLKIGLDTIPFVIGTYILIKAQTLVSIDSNVVTYPSISIFHQLTFLTLPFIKTFYIGNIKSSIETLTPLVIIVYIASTVFLLKKVKNLRPLILSVFIALPLSIYQSIYLNPVFLDYYDSSRYLYYSSILFSIFWGLVFWQLSLYNRFMKVILGVFVVSWIFYNNFLVSKEFDNWQERQDPLIATINYMKVNQKNIPDKTTIVVPIQVGFYGSQMLGYLYKRDTYFVPFDENIIETLKNKTIKSNVKSDIIYLKYDAFNKSVVPIKEND